MCGHVVSEQLCRRRIVVEGYLVCQSSRWRRMSTRGRSSSNSAREVDGCQGERSRTWFGIPLVGFEVLVLGVWYRPGLRPGFTGKPKVYPSDVFPSNPSFPYTYSL
jgi:hypothetical protein